MGIDGKFHLHLILEGYEETAFFEVVKAKGTHESIELTFFNSRGAERIPAFYQDAFSNEEFDLVLCVYDVDYKFALRDSACRQTLEKLVETTGSKKRASLISFLTNPNILLWFLVGACELKKLPRLHCGKASNTSLLHQYWPKIGNGMETCDDYKCYDAKEWQLDEMMYSYLNDDYSYDNVLSRGIEIDKNIESDANSSNLFPLLKVLKEGNIDFFIRIVKEIDK